MSSEGRVWLKVNQSTVFKPFNCGDEDLNDFLVTKAKLYANELLAVTYVLEDYERTIAYFSIFNDSLRIEKLDYASKSAFNRFISELVPHGKRHLQNFPALKIGRLAVSTDTRNQERGIGKSIIYTVIDIAIRQNETTGCKLLTVDAYEQSLGFYEKMGFHYLSSSDEGKDTRQMYFDLTPIINKVKAEEQ